jgi:glycerol-3-phosphate O-acyltransferase/dihydroxyacetone phosphate acyltransferase
MNADQGRPRPRRFGGESNVRDAADRVVQTFARLVAKLWFRSIETDGVDAIPLHQPVLLAANHANGFVDPVLVLAAVRRPVRFLAKATLWKVPGLGVALDLVGVLPVHRPRDHDGGSNVRVFAACDDELAHDGVIGIFPEGTVSEDLRLLPLKTGAARIALSAKAMGAGGLVVVPVGLLYQDRMAPRTRALVRAGAPIELDARVGELVDEAQPADDTNLVAVERLTALIAAGLDEAYTDFTDEDEHRTLFAAAAVKLRPPGANPSFELPIAAVERVARVLEGAAGRDAVMAAASAYRGQLDLLGVHDADVVPGNTLPRLRKGLNRSAAKVLALAPMAVVGAGLNVVPFAAVYAASHRSKAPVSVANNTLLAALAAFPLAWVGWALLGRGALRHPWRTALLAGPLCGQAAVVCWEELDRMRRARLQWQRITMGGDLLEAVRKQRAAVMAAVDDALASPVPA